METSFDRAELRARYFAAYDEHKAEVDERIADGIERHRKGDARVRITDESGAPLAHKRVTIRQKSHDFKLGANLFLLDEFASDAENAAYRELFRDTFNLATLPFYHSTLEPVEGSPRFAADSPKIYRRPAPDLCLDYCAEAGITPKLHCLYYDKFAPDWLKTADLDTAKAKLERRFAEIAERYAGRMFEFEVTNELFCVHDRQTALSRWRDMIPFCFELARKYFPTDKLTINEAVSHPDIARQDYYHPYFMQVDGLLAKGVPIDRIGMQNHQFTGVSATTREAYDASVLSGVKFNDPMSIFRALDVMSELGRPLEITEVTTPTFGTSEADEQLQADMLELWMRVWFSHPAIDCVVYWNTVDGMTFAVPGWNENNCRGGLWRRDPGAASALTPKKAATMLQKLFGEEWRTNLELTSDGDGFVDFRGFFGDYEAIWDGGSLEFGLHK